MPRTPECSQPSVEDPVRALVRTWSDEASVLRTRYGDHRLAALAEAHAVDLQKALESRDGEHLSLEQASAESGYSVAHLRRLVATGQLHNAGRRGRPRIQRDSLPQKAHIKRGLLRRAQVADALDVSDLVADALRRQGA